MQIKHVCHGLIPPTQPTGVVSEMLHHTPTTHQWHSNIGASLLFWLKKHQPKTVVVLSKNISDRSAKCLLMCTRSGRHLREKSLYLYIFFSSCWHWLWKWNNRFKSNCKVIKWYLASEEHHFSMSYFRRKGNENCLFFWGTSKISWLLDLTSSKQNQTQFQFSVLVCTNWTVHQKSF